MIRSFPALAFSAMFFTLFGCAIGSLAPDSATEGAALRGNIHGGQQAIVNARVYVFSAAVTGYAVSSDSLLSAASTGHSDSNGAYVLSGTYGDFSITGAYTCVPGRQVYVLALGGNPGLTVGTDNTAIALMAAIGPCPAAGNFAATVPFITVNEVSTVAAVYSLAGFMTSPTAISTSATPLGSTGLANAFATVANLSDLASGVANAKTPAVTGYSVAQGLSANGTVPQSEINALANTISACINTSSAASAQCASLFANATSDGTPTGTRPAETVTALLNIAHNPAANVSNLFLIAPAIPPFQPTLLSTPDSWTVELTFTAPQLSQSFNGSADAQGNIWIPDLDNSKIVKFSPTGTVLSGTAGFAGGNSPLDVAIDSLGNAWVATVPGVLKLSPDGTSQSTVTAGTNQRTSLAFDPSGNAILNSYDSLYQISSDLSVTHGPYAHNQILATNQIAVDTAGTTWAPQANNSTIISITNDGATVIAHSGAGLSAPSGVAIDGSGNIWVGNQGGGVSELNFSGTIVSAYGGGGSTQNEGVAIDGDGKVFTVSDPNVISIFSPTGTALSPSTGYAGAFRYPTGAILDGSGNVWIPNRLSGSISEFIGLAAPTYTPILPTHYGTRP